MAVARHSDNIEVQDGDQDDPDYENETTATARRLNVEMSEEGHYERLDLQKIDDAVYEDLRTKKKQSGRRPFRVVAGCLVVLCLMLLGVVITQAVHYHNQLILMGDRLKTDHAKVTLERDQLNASYINLTLEHGQLKNRSHSTLTLENSRLKILNNNHNQLTTNYTALLRERNQLQSEVNQLKTQPADKSCLSGWKKFADSCYYKTTGVKTWQQNRDECLSHGADLVVINSREEQVFIRGLNPGGTFASWIGLARTQGRWTWVDGTPLTTQYWVRGWPPNDGDKNCAAYNHGTDRGTWFNGGCSGTAFSICETK